MFLTVYGIDHPNIVIAVGSNGLDRTWNTFLARLSDHLREIEDRVIASLELLEEFLLTILTVND